MSKIDRCLLLLEITGKKCSNGGFRFAKKLVFAVGLRSGSTGKDRRVFWSLVGSTGKDKRTVCVGDGVLCLVLVGATCWSDRRDGGRLGGR